MLMAVLRLASVGAVVLWYRYALKLGKPKQDWWLVVEYGLRIKRSVMRRVNMLRVWLIGLIRYVPSHSLEGAWRELRARYSAGKYGELGT